MSCRVTTSPRELIAVLQPITVTSRPCPTVAIRSGIKNPFTAQITEITKFKPTNFFVCFVSFVVNEIIVS